MFKVGQKVRLAKSGFKHLNGSEVTIVDLNSKSMLNKNETRIKVQFAQGGKLRVTADCLEAL